MSSLPPLTRALVSSPALASRRDLVLPNASHFDFPVRVAQFGTGGFLRGFIDAFVDEANHAGTFDGRIVAIGSTDSGRDAALTSQDGLYTLVARGLVHGVPHERRRVVAAVSRAISARDAWDDVLALARSDDLCLVVSNTTEVGIVHDTAAAATDAPPRSFPAKLARFLAERARAVGYDDSRGVVVVPCELIERNGERLGEIVIAHLRAWWPNDDRLVRWIERAVPFCNTLVDRIVPGAPSDADGDALRAALGYDDALLTTSEIYRLFAIERPRTARGARMVERLGIIDAGRGIVVVDDVGPYRERKLRLLNGTHTIMVPLALLAGCTTVGEAVAEDGVGRFVRRVLLEELVPMTDAPDAEAFAHDVLDRFANPFIDHALVDITLQATMKMRVRIVPMITRYAARAGRPPASLAFGFAAFLLFMRGDVHEARRRRGATMPEDGHADVLREAWRAHGSAVDADTQGLVDRIGRAEAVWGTDLTAIPGFAPLVAEHLGRMQRDGIHAALEHHLAEAAV